MHGKTARPAIVQSRANVSVCVSKRPSRALAARLEALGSRGNWAVQAHAIASPGSCVRRACKAGKSAGIGCTPPTVAMISRLPPITSRWHRARPSPTKPDQIWVTDITYVETAEGWLYLAGVLDLYSRRLIGWAMGSSLETALPLAALHMALRQRRPLPGVLHHSDRGCQYASAVYRQTLADHGCVASMSRKGNCYDNATMESFWSTLKHELIYRCRWATRAQATTVIFDYIEGFYNRTRLHSALGYQSPLDYESNLN